MGVNHRSLFKINLLIIGLAVLLLIGCQTTTNVSENSDLKVDITTEPQAVDSPPTLPPPPTIPPPASPTAIATTIPTLLPTATLITSLATVPASPTTAIANTATAIPLNTQPPAEEPDTAVVETAVPAYGTYLIGNSLQGRPIIATQFGQGPKHITLVGGIHGGYEWNSIVLSHRLINHFIENPGEIPAGVTLTIIPSANPDGHYLISGEDGNFDTADISIDTSPGRFSANWINGLPVDLNRNWDCNWAPTALWRDNEVSGGTSPFSEPETAALRDFFLNDNPQAVIFLHSAANGVFVSGCNAIHMGSVDLANVYANSANYPIFDSFDYYEITGDAGDWLTTQGISSISIELITHEAIEFDKNLSGLRAVLDYYDN